MFYGIEQSTDLRDRRTVIKKFQSLTTLQKWMKNSGGFTYENPEESRNYHHTFRSGYELVGRVNKSDPIFKKDSTYHSTANDKMTRYIWKYGKEIENGN